MSKGPGKWQRLILATLQEHRGFPVRDLLPRHASRAELNALYRAVRLLERVGRIDVMRCWSGNTPLTRCAVVRHGEHPTYADIEAAHCALRGLNVGAVPPGYHANTYAPMERQP